MTAADDKPTTPSFPPSAERVQEVKTLAEKLAEKLHELELDDAAREELKAHIAAVQVQLTAAEPDHSIVDEALAAMHRLLESSTARKATELLAEVGRFLTGVG